VVAAAAAAAAARAAEGRLERSQHHEHIDQSTRMNENEHQPTNQPKTTNTHRFISFDQVEQILGLPWQHTSYTHRQDMDQYDLCVWSRIRE
jgi:tRNA(Met) C34 N-acetyltransferase TmcA